MNHQSRNDDICVDRVRVTMACSVMADGFYGIDLLLSRRGSAESVLPIAHGAQRFITPRQMSDMKHALVVLAETALSQVLDYDPF